MAKRIDPADKAGEDPLWYKDAVIYELHVKTFFDSNGDGIGDFKGLTEKLDYLQDLGVTAIWILPFYPSPLRDDGYDIADYYNVHPDYGTLKDFKKFLGEAQRRGLKVITELVINHTSDQHPWFQKARRAKPGSPARDFYVWSDTGTEYAGTRIIFKDFETSNWAWDPVANAFYWHRFYSHQPDLNFDSEEVHEAVFTAMEHWFDMGVDGMRLDAIPYLYEREGTSSENLPEGHEFLKKLRKRLDSRYHARMLLAEANQWPEDAVEYFGDGDECHMSFHFPVMPRLFMALHMEDRYPIIDILAQTPEIPENCQWATFLRNHDELTLEMVTDEERDYMYRIYANDPRMRVNLGIRRRLAPLLNNNRRRIELMNGLLFSLPGTPVIYYGDEIGMGDNIYIGDRNGVRTPMQWSGDRNAGFSRTNPQKLYLPVIIDPEYHYESLNVEAQRGNMQSLFWWMKRIIALRKQHKAFGRGTIKFLDPENSKIIAFIREYEDEQILIVANLSRFAQPVELGLSEYRGVTPVELFGKVEFPPIGGLPYFLTLGPHAFYWFLLERREVEEAPSWSGSAPLPSIPCHASNWAAVTASSSRQHLLKALTRYIRSKKWFLSPSRKIKDSEIADAIAIPAKDTQVLLIFVKIDYSEGEPDLYVVPVAHGEGERAGYVETDLPHQLIARTQEGDRHGILFDALADRDACLALLDFIEKRRRVKGEQGELAGTQTHAYRKLRGNGRQPLEPVLYRSDRSNTSVNFSDRMMLKMIRRLEPGVNPEYEIGQLFSQRENHVYLAPLAGALDYFPASGKPMTASILHGYVENQGDAWHVALDQLEQYLEHVFLAQAESLPARLPRKKLLAMARSGIDRNSEEHIGAFVAMARLLGQRTAEMHVALASEEDDPSFAPEPFTPFYQRSLFQSMRNRTATTMKLLRKELKSLPREIQHRARQVLDLEKDILATMRRVSGRKIDASRIRIHGNLNLQEVLWTGRDFVIIDFEGDALRPLSERRIKRCPLRDVAAMVRSFDYAVYTSYFHLCESGLVQKEGLPKAESWLRLWRMWIAASFLGAYLETDSIAPLLPANPEDAEILLEAFLLERALYELTHEIQLRPDWARIPLQAVLRLMGRNV